MSDSSLTHPNPSSFNLCPFFNCTFPKSVWHGYSCTSGHIWSFPPCHMWSFPPCHSGDFLQFSPECKSCSTSYTWNCLQIWVDQTKNSKSLKWWLVAAKFAVNFVKVHDRPLHQGFVLKLLPDATLWSSGQQPHRFYHLNLYLNKNKSLKWLPGVFRLTRSSAMTCYCSRGRRVELRQPDCFVILKTFYCSSFLISNIRQDHVGWAKAALAKAGIDFFF